VAKHVTISLMMVFMSQYYDKNMFLTFATIPVNYAELQWMHLINMCTLVNTAFKVDNIISYSTIPAGRHFLIASLLSFITLFSSFIMTPMILAQLLSCHMWCWPPTALAGCCHSITSNQSATHQENPKLPAVGHRRCVFLLFLYPATYMLQWISLINDI
jgi:hypothetical protein